MLGRTLKPVPALCTECAIRSGIVNSVINESRVVLNEEDAFTDSVAGAKHKTGTEDKCVPYHTQPRRLY